ncbi:MAG: heme-binding protein [Planctomycetes bacterium]|nr:heme-binding protein [Planctomycetota bacterium]
MLSRLTATGLLMALASLASARTVGDPSSCSQTSKEKSCSTTAACDAAGLVGKAKQDMAPGQIRRIAGDMDAKVEAIPTNTEENGETIQFDMYRFGDMKITTPLPEGYPAPTPPKALDIKGYPLVRRAQVKGQANPDIGMNVGFWPLFNHIKKREIAMTSPVEMEYGATQSQEKDAAPQWTMAFLYRTTDLGPTGTAKENERVEVVDVQPMTVISMGFKGVYSRGMVDTAVASLRSELAKHTEWEIAGEPRALYYNGPEMPNGRKWGEVQIPIKPRSASDMVPIKIESASIP